MAKDSLSTEQKRKPMTVSQKLFGLAVQAFAFFYGLWFLAIFLLAAYTAKSKFRKLSAKEKQDLASGNFQPANRYSRVTNCSSFSSRQTLESDESSTAGIHPRIPYLAQRG
jgi:hypothetical protein